MEGLLSTGLPRLDLQITHPISNLDATLFQTFTGGFQTFLPASNWLTQIQGKSVTKVWNTPSKVWNNPTEVCKRVAQKA